MKIGERILGQGHPVYIIAEMSANHGQRFDDAVEMIKVAKQAGADAVKLQTYTPDTMTIDSDAPPFVIEKGSLWEGRTLHDVYREGSMPWEWQPELKKIADQLGIQLFSSVFDLTSVEFLEKIDMPAYKISSFELVDIPLIKKTAETGKPLILSTGMSTISEIEEAVNAFHSVNKSNDIALLKCTSAYPAPPEKMHLKTITYLREKFGLNVGLSDHSKGVTAVVASIALGASIIEKHFTLSHSKNCLDDSFSLDPEEFRYMVQSIREAEKALGKPTFGPLEGEISAYRRSLYIVKDIQAGEPLTTQNIRSIRPAGGLHTRHLEDVLGKMAKNNLLKGSPLQWESIQ